MSLLLKQSFAAILVVFAVLSHPRAMQGQVLTFTTFAGSRAGAGFEDGTGSAARFDHPQGVATDSSGNVYVADTNNSTIRKITPAGAVTTLAGLTGVVGSADGTGSAARFNFVNPNSSMTNGVATDNSGNVYVADSGNHTIRKISPAGAVTTLAGLAGAFGSADGTGSAARFDYPSGVAIDGIGNVYVADTNNNTIRKITPGGVVTTLAGLAGTFGSIDGTGSAARFWFPQGVATDSSGNVYVADLNNYTIRKITPGGVVTTLAGLAGTFGSADGTGSAARFSIPVGVATDNSGNVYVADYGRIRKITPAAVVTSLAGGFGSPGSIDGTGSATLFFWPLGVATDSSGNVYVADTNNSTIRKITPAAAVTTLAGLAGEFGNFGSADGTGSAARFVYPDGVATDNSGNVYVADTANTIRKITPGGVVTTLAGLAGTFGSADGTGSAARFSLPFGVATDTSGNVYVAEFWNHTIRKISPAGAVTTLAGLAGAFGSTDGTGSEARFGNPRAVATDSSGNVYVADSGNDAIRKITPAGTVTTLAGLAGVFGSTDGTGSAARFYGPHGVAVDGSGNVYVADKTNSTIRKITPAGAVTTLAGLAGVVGSADGTGSAARFAYPQGVATDSSGNVYVADSGNTIRKITPGGTVTTLAGLAGVFGSTDGTGSAARFAGPVGVATDSSSGNVYVADTQNHTIRIGRAVLADVATIDVTTGPAFVTRQLDTSPQTATSWQWSVIRRPVDSVADLSSATVRNPTFTPDVPGLFTFGLDATGISASSITTVDLTATQGVLAAPATFSATATSSTAVNLACATVSGATGYEIFRSTGNSEFASLKIVTGATTSDTGLTADTTYLYKVRALGSGAPSAFSAIDAATTTVFTDDPLAVGGIIMAVHITQLRTAVNAMRAAAGLQAAAFTDSTLTTGGTIIKAAHVTELRTALDAARWALGLPSISYTDSTVTAGVTVMKAAHLTELRSGTQ